MFGCMDLSTIRVEASDPHKVWTTQLPVGSCNRPLPMVSVTATPCLSYSQCKPLDSNKRPTSSQCSEEGSTISICSGIILPYTRDAVVINRATRDADIYLVCGPTVCSHPYGLSPADKSAPNAVERIPSHIGGGPELNGEGAT